MKIGIIGLPQSGKKTIFKVIIRLRGDRDVDVLSQTEPLIVSIVVDDERLKFLNTLFKAKRMV